MPTGKVEIRFQVFDSKDPKVLLIGDYSNWLIYYDDASYISITPPGSNEAITYTFNKKTISEFNSETLYLGCSDCDDELSDLSDGIWKIRVFSAQSEFFEEKYYLKTDVHNLNRAKKLIEIGFHYNDVTKQKFELIQKSDFYLEKAIAHTTAGEIKEAQRFFEEAQNILNCKECHSNRY